MDRARGRAGSGNILLRCDEGANSVDIRRVHSELSEGLLAQCPNNFQRIHLALFWMEVLLNHGERQAAVHVI